MSYVDGADSFDITIDVSSFVSPGINIYAVAIEATLVDYYPKVASLVTSLDVKVMPLFDAWIPPLQVTEERKE